MHKFFSTGLWLCMLIIMTSCRPSWKSMRLSEGMPKVSDNQVTIINVSEKMLKNKNELKNSLKGKIPFGRYIVGKVSALIELKPCPPDQECTGGPYYLSRLLPHSGSPSILLLPLTFVDCEAMADEKMEEWYQDLPEPEKAMMRKKLIEKGKAAKIEQQHCMKSSTTPVAFEACLMDCTAYAKSNVDRWAENNAKYKRDDLFEVVKNSCERAFPEQKADILKASSFDEFIGSFLCCRDHIYNRVKFPDDLQGKQLAVQRAGMLYDCEKATLRQKGCIKKAKQYKQFEKCLD